MGSIRKIILFLKQEMILSEHLSWNFVKFLKQQNEWQNILV